MTDMGRLDLEKITEVQPDPTQPERSDLEVRLQKLACGAYGEPVEYYRRMCGEAADELAALRDENAKLRNNHN